MSDENWLQDQLQLTQKRISELENYYKGFKKRFVEEIAELREDNKNFRTEMHRVYMIARNELNELKALGGEKEETEEESQRIADAEEAREVAQYLKLTKEKPPEPSEHDKKIMKDMIPRGVLESD